MADIFLSYKREDREKVRPLVEALQEQGWSVWWDTRVGVAETWDAVIEAEIKTARCVLVVWSPLSIESRWVRSEAHEGLERNCLVPVTIGSVRQPLAFRLIQSSDLSGWKGNRNDAAFVQVCEAAARLVGREAAQPRSPPAPPPQLWRAMAAYVADRKKTTVAVGIAVISAILGAIAYLPSKGVPPTSVGFVAPTQSPLQPQPAERPQTEAGASALAGTDCDATLPSATAILACGHVISRASSAEALSVRGDAYRRQAKYTLAIADLDNALTLKPKDSLARSRRGYAYEMMRRRDLATADYEAVLAAKPGSALDHLARCEANLGRHNYDRANAECSSAIQRDPLLVLAYTSRAGARVSLQDYDGALADANAAIRLVDRYAVAYLERGRTYHAMSDFERAFADYDKAIEIDPHHLWTYIVRGGAHRVAKNYASALADYKRSIELAPRETWAYSGRGEVYFEMKDYARAIADHDQAIMIDGQNAFAYNGRGNVYFETKFFDRAIDDYTAAITIDNSFTWALNNRAYAYRSRGRPGDRDSAIADFRRALTLEPDFENSVRGLREMGIEP